LQQRRAMLDDYCATSLRHDALMPRVLRAAKSGAMMARRSALVMPVCRARPAGASLRLHEDDEWR